jgi:hypothetical protein
MVVVHSGFDGLKVTIQADIPLELRGRLIEAKKQATLMCGDCVIDVRGLGLAVRHASATTFQLAEVAVTGTMVRAILAAIRRLRSPPTCA